MPTPSVYIILDSVSRHVYDLSLAIVEGLRSKGVNAEIYLVPEDGHASIQPLSDMNAPSPNDTVQSLDSVYELSKPDGILFGHTTSHFNTISVSLKKLFDSTGSLWCRGALANKFGSTFTCACCIVPQQSTFQPAASFFAHHGMLYVPFERATDRQPSRYDLIKMAKQQGEIFGTIVATYVRGLEARKSDEYKTKHISDENYSFLSTSSQSFKEDEIDYSLGWSAETVYVFRANEPQHERFQQQYLNTEATQPPSVNTTTTTTTTSTTTTTPNSQWKGTAIDITGKNNADGRATATSNTNCKSTVGSNTNNSSTLSNANRNSDCSGRQSNNINENSRNSVNTKGKGKGKGNNNQANDCIELANTLVENNSNNNNNNNNNRTSERTRNERRSCGYWQRWFCLSHG